MSFGIRGRTALALVVLKQFRRSLTLDHSNVSLQLPSTLQHKSSERAERHSHLAQCIIASLSFTPFLSTRPTDHSPQTLPHQPTSTFPFVQTMSRHGILDLPFVIENTLPSDDPTVTS